MANPITPPKTVCETQARLAKQAAEIKIAIKNGKKTIRKITDKITEILFGIIVFSNSELLAAAQGMASQLTSALVGAVSGLVGSIVQAFFSYILQILSSVSGIFSLVKIPLERAKFHTLNEHKRLLEMRASMYIVIGIMSKWLRRTNRQDFSGKLKTIIPILDRIRDDLSVVLSGLNTGRNRKFDRVSYNRALSNIDKVIQESVLESRAGEHLSIRDKMADEEQRVYRVRIQAINEWYKEEKRKIGQEYSDAIARYQRLRDERVGDQFISTVDKTSKIKDRVERFGRTSGEAVLKGLYTIDDKNKYELKIRKLNVQKQWKITRAKADSKADAYRAIFNGARDLYKTVADEFRADMTIMEDELVNVADKWSGAALSYNLSNFMSNRVYNFGEVVSNIMNSIVDVIREIGNASAKAAVKPISGALSITEKSLEKAKDAAAYSRGGSSDRPVKRALNTMASDAVIAGNIALINGFMNAADGLLGATISEEMIDLINLDDVLENENEDFKKFRGRLADIPDWDGTKGVWAVDLNARTTSPYIDFGSAVVTLTKGVGESIADFNGDTEFQEAANETIDVVNRLLRHNREVMSVLSSYNPEPNETVDKLNELLNKLRLIELFSAGLVGIKAIVNFIKLAANGELQILGCREAYAELFSSDAGSEAQDVAAVSQKKDAILITELVEAQRFIDDTKDERETLRYQLNTMTSQTPLSDIANLPPSKC